jgi:gluconate 2-dehydrogenase gamma chain
MDRSNVVSRRELLAAASALSSTTLMRLGSVALAALTQAACTARQQAAAFAVLGEREASDLAAIAARIMPTTDTPGATEAGVIYFFDQAFAAQMSSALEPAREGLAAFNAALHEAHPGVEEFGHLPVAEQDVYLAARENSEFFGLVWQMTMFGFFAMSSYGGNKDNLGWKLIGFEGHQGAWQYPFGYYDAAVHGGAENAE